MDEKGIISFARPPRDVGVLHKMSEIEQTQSRIAPYEMMQGSEVAQIDDDLVVVRVRTMQGEGKVAGRLQRRSLLLRRVSLLHKTAIDEHVKPALAKLIYERLPIDIGRRVLFLGAD